MLDNLIFDRTAADVANRTEKGRYRYTDMNRVQDAVTSIRQRYIDAGYNMTGYPIFVWQENAIPRYSQANQYLTAVKSLDGIVKLREKVTLPRTMNALDYNGANNIEKFLYLTGEAFENLASAWWYSDEIYSGEVDM